MKHGKKTGKIFFFTRAALLKVGRCSTLPLLGVTAVGMCERGGGIMRNGIITAHGGGRGLSVGGGV
jgi:hypothetical protein